MAKVITITLRKGGSGKTTTAVNLASSLAKHGKKVLLIDLDPQANATISLGIRYPNTTPEHSRGTYRAYTLYPDN
jgi:chromosome partitioning protein